MNERIELFDVPLDCVDMELAVEIARQHILSGTIATAILAVNPEKIVRAKTDRVLRKILSNALLCIPDGIGAVLAARLKGHKDIARVPGSELMPELCRLAAKGKHGVFLFGGTEAANKRATEVLQQRYPELRVAGRASGYVPIESHNDLVGQINASGAKILFVALGSPAQELWIERHRGDFDTVLICQGVGGTFDVLAGTVKRAPEIMRRFHLEWLFRLVTQPSRISRQRSLPIFSFWVLRAFFTRSL